MAEVIFNKLEKVYSTALKRYTLSILKLLKGNSW